MQTIHFFTAIVIQFAFEHSLKWKPVFSLNLGKGWNLYYCFDKSHLFSFFIYLIFRNSYLGWATHWFAVSLSVSPDLVFLQRHAVSLSTARDNSHLGTFPKNILFHGSRQRNINLSPLLFTFLDDLLGLLLNWCETHLALYITITLLKTFSKENKSLNTENYMLILLTFGWNVLDTFGQQQLGDLYSPTVLLPVRMNIPFFSEQGVFCMPSTYLFVMASCI